MSSRLGHEKGIWVHRPDISGYLEHQYLKSEESILLASGIGRYTFGPEVSLNGQSPDIIITTSNTKTQELADSGVLKNTRLIIHPNSGHDNFSVDFVRQFKGRIILGNTLRARAVADYILHGVLTYAHYATMHLNSHYHGPLPKTVTWDDKRRYPRQLLETKQALVIGFGHIGKLVKQGLDSVGIKVTVYDPFLLSQTPLPVLQDQNIICLCASLNPTSQYLVNQKFLEQLPENFLLINAARGGLVDFSALIQSLEVNTSAFALLDVFPYEPFAFDHTQAPPNLHCTSHIAGVFDQLPMKMLAFIKDAVTQFINDPNGKTEYPILKDRLRENFLI
ncbi:MAG: hypothetical protein HYV97_09490 [Bdellovibrio sp.]|nr:hypothetical protein [Bdellovibrio sp.]